MRILAKMFPSSQKCHTIGSIAMQRRSKLRFFRNFGQPFRHKKYDPSCACMSLLFEHCYIRIAKLQRRGLLSFSFVFQVVFDLVTRMIKRRLIRIGLLCSPPCTSLFWRMKNCEIAQNYLFFEKCSSTFQNVKKFRFLSNLKRCVTSSIQTSISCIFRYRSSFLTKPEEPFRLVIK